MPSGYHLHHQRFTVAYEYPVYFTREVFDPSNPTLQEALRRREPARRHRALFVVDSGVWGAWPDLERDLRAYCAAHAASLQLVGAPAVVPGGEHIKETDAAVRALHAQLHGLGIDRQSFVVIVGGGAVLDAAGYAAATTHRGVRVVRVPTTVLAQGDAGLGVKNGVNAFGAKNFLGTFAPPFAVINDASFLRTLPAREARSGMAEAVKVALIRDAAFFAWLRERAAALASGDLSALEELVRRAAEIHLAHIATAGDPFEQGSARPLDFGHWAAHKLESLSGHRVRHGEAVAIGMAIDSRYSVERGLLAERDCEAILSLLRALGFRLWDDALAAREPDGTPALLAGLREFREHLGGELAVTLLTGIGRTVEAHELDHALVLRAAGGLEREDPPR